MNRYPLVILVACGALGCGGKASGPRDPAPPPEPRATRVPIEEPAEEEGVSFVNARGKMDTATVAAGLAPHTEALTDCFMSNYGTRRWLGGQVVIHWDIQHDGMVTGVRMAESDLGNWTIERCLLDVARSVTFAKPAGGDADFSVPLEFTAKGRSITWDEDTALRAVGGQVAGLDACGKGKVRGPQGEVAITLYVGPGGKVQSVGFATANPTEEAWTDCAEKAVQAWRLPDPRGSIAKLTAYFPRR